MLKVTDLYVNYGHVSALRGVSFHVPKGEIVTLIGANGAGKTTTLLSISGLVPKLSGKVEFDGINITAERPDRIVKMGICHVPEGRHVFPDLSVYENLVMGSLAHKKLSKSETADLVEQQFVLFPRLRERFRQMAGTLSGGEQQMLAIARGLMGSPKLLILDEPSLGLAPIVIDEIFELIVKIRGAGTTVLLIEQNATIALSTANHAYVLQLGVVSLSDTGRELLNNPEVKKAYLGL
jgi:branched-chain amino acid transport system ATP-binding protein